MATHSSVLARRIPGTEEPGGLPSMGSHSRTRLRRLSSSSSSGTVLAPLDASFSLQIEDQGLVEFDLSSWTHLILIDLHYALGLCHFFKS